METELLKTHLESNNNGIESNFHTENGKNSTKCEYPFKLHWVFGYDTAVPPINISSSTVKGVFFTSGSIGICFNWTKNEQAKLFGHVGNITSTASTPDKSYLASADSGCDNSLIVWHARTGKAVFIVHAYFSEEGVIWMCFSDDGNVLLTLNKGNPQELALWNWKSKKTLPFCSYKFKKHEEFQHYAAFQSRSCSYIATCSKSNVFFFKLVENELTFSVVDMYSLYDKKTCKRIGDFTQTVFSPVSSLAYTATTKGMFVLWGLSHYTKDKSGEYSKSGFINPKDRICLRAVQILESRESISFVGLHGNFIILGTGDSRVCWFDESFKLLWSINIKEGSITGVSFNMQPRFTLKEIVFRVMGKDIAKNSDKKSDFIVSTANGYIGYVTFSSAEATCIFLGASNLVKSVAVHPSRPLMYTGDSRGVLLKWNYETKELLSKDIFHDDCSQIECISIDINGLYIACAFVSGRIAIFDAVCFDSKPVFIGNEVLYKPTFLKFSPDPQHLLVVNDAAFVSRYQLHLLVPPQVFQMLKKDNIPSEEPLWCFKGKTRQHRGHIVDCFFNILSLNESVCFFTLGEDRYVVQYNISNSRDKFIEVTKRIHLTWNSDPLCMSCYPLYGLNNCIGVVSIDGKLCVYNLESEKLIKLVTMPQYEESFKRIFLCENFMNKKTEDSSARNYLECLIFSTKHLIGLSKYPIDGDPRTSLAMSTHPNGINYFVTNKEETFLFTAGMKDSWIHMYEINPMALPKDETDLNAYKCLFPTNEEAEEMKMRLVYSVYALELEMKLLKLGVNEEPNLLGEIPINFIEYVFAALGCFMSIQDLQMMMDHINLENQYLHKGVKKTLNCLDIMKLYINYRPKVPISKESVIDTFRDILALEGDPDRISRAQFLSILETRGDRISKNELLDILNCLKDTKPKYSSIEENMDSSKHEAETVESNVLPKRMEIEDFIPETITEEVFVQDILCLEKAEDDLSEYILKRDDYKLRQEPPTVDDFVIAVKESNLWQE